LADEDVELPAPKRAKGSVVRLVAWLVAVLLVVGAGLYFWWQQVPSEDDLREQAGLKGKAQLFVGVADDNPGVALKDPKTGSYTGFDIDIAYLIAADLGFRPNEVRFLTIENEDRNRMRAADEQGHFLTVDLVISTYSITEERERERSVSFSAPYLDTEQSVMTLKGVPAVQDMSDLAGKTVCTITTSTSRNPASDAGAKVVGKRRISECLPGLRNHELDAVTTDAAILAGYVALEPEVFQHHDIGLAVPEEWGVNTGGNDNLTKLVNLSLYRSHNDPEDKRWEDAYDRNLRAEERASFPQPVANDKQPDVDEVEVRQWPWERLAGTIRPIGATDRRRRRTASSGR
jgi:glutamate transport system substrate-binding protein